jgi:N-carbamoylputrescine amidase
MISKAAKDGAKLVIMPELHQGPYFCQCEMTEYFALASDFEEDKRYWSNVAKTNNIVLVTSLFEKRAPGLYHNTAVVFDTDGKECGSYRKMHIPDDPGFYEKFYFTPGDLGFEPIDTSIGRLGVLICWDQWYPEAARLMTLKGAQILIYPTAIGWFDEDDNKEKQRQLDSWISIQKSHSIANGIPVIAVNRCGFENDPNAHIDGINFWGNSFAYNGGGELLVKGSNDQEEVLFCDIDLDESAKFRDIWPFLRDRRIDAYDNLTKRFID